MWIYYFKVSTNLKSHTLKSYYHIMQMNTYWMDHNLYPPPSARKLYWTAKIMHHVEFAFFFWGARWLSGRVSDSGARGRGFDTYRRRVVSLSKTLYSPKVLVNYPGSGGSVPTWLKNCWLGRKASTQTNKFFFLVVRDNFKILYIQINFPAYKDYLCSNFKWFDSHAKNFGEKW